MIALLVIQLGTIAGVLARGQALNIDTLNDHVYVLWSLSHRQQDFAWAPGGAGSYLPTTWNVPWWLVLRHMGGRAVGVYLGVLDGLSLWLVWVIARDLGRRARVASPGLAAWSAVVFAAMSAMFILELGSTFGDIATAPLVLTSVLLALREGAGTRTVFVAGAACGAAFGLKLTNGPYVPALLALVLCLGHSRVKRLCATTAGIWLGALAAGGWWWLKMFKRFGNPFFPFFGNLFSSAYGPDTSLTDQRWHKSVAGLVREPWSMATAQYPVETPFRDSRWVVLILLVTISAAVVALSNHKSGPKRFTRASTATLAHVGVAFVFWGLVFGYGRYLLSSDLLVAALLPVFAHALAPRRKALQILTSVAVFAALLAPLRLYPPVTTGWEDDWTAVRLPPVAKQPHEMLVLIGNDGLSHVIASAPGNARAVQMPTVFGLSLTSKVDGHRVDGKEIEDVRSAIELEHGPLVALMEPGEAAAGARIASGLGLRQDEMTCQTFAAHVQRLDAAQLNIPGVGQFGAPVATAARRPAVACEWTRAGAPER